MYSLWDPEPEYDRMFIYLLIVNLRNVITELFKKQHKISRNEIQVAESLTGNRRVL